LSMMKPTTRRPTRLPPTMARISNPATRPVHNTPSPTKNVAGAAFSAALLVASATTPQMTGIVSRTITATTNSTAMTTSRPVIRIAICRACWAAVSLIVSARNVLLVVPARNPGIVRPRSTVAGNARRWTLLARRPGQATLMVAKESLASRTGHTAEDSPAPRPQNPGNE
jgi:hypothetical protein